MSETSQIKREPLINISVGKRGVGRSLQSENKDDAFLLTEKFMHNLKIGDSFTLNNTPYFVKRMGKYKTTIAGKEKSFKTLTLKSYSKKIEMFINNDTDKRFIVQKQKDSGNFDSLTFYFWSGIHGNPRSRQKNACSRQYNFLRDIEGQLIVDLINYNNPLHEMSEIYKIANQD